MSPGKEDRRWSANPGSREAISQGCICAVIDNNHGQRPVIPPADWWITEGCPVHAPSPPPEPVPAAADRPPAAGTVPSVRRPAP